MESRKAYGDVDAVRGDSDAAKEGEGSAIGVIETDEGREIRDGGVLVVEKNTGSIASLGWTVRSRHWSLFKTLIPSPNLMTWKWKIRMTRARPLYYWPYKRSNIIRGVCTQSPVVTRLAIFHLICRYLHGVLPWYSFFDVNGGHSHGLFFLRCATYPLLPISSKSWVLVP